MTRNPHVPRRALAVAAGGILIGSFGAWALTAGAAHRTPATPTHAPGSAGMRVAIQPESGALVAPDAEQSKALEAGTTADDAADLVVQSRPGGGQYVHVEGHFLNYEVARRGPDGKLQQACLETPAAVRQFLHGQAAPAATRLEVK